LFIYIIIILETFLESSALRNVQLQAYHFELQFWSTQ